MKNKKCPECGKLLDQNEIAIVVGEWVDGEWKDHHFHQHVPYYSEEKFKTPLSQSAAVSWDNRHLIY